MCIRKKLALEMGWFKEDPAVADPQFAVKMGPNIVMETCGNVIPYSNDIKVKWTSKGTTGATEYPQKYWIIPIMPDGELSDYIRLSLDVNWRFGNLNFSFKSVFGPTSRSLYVYSNVGSSSVVGDQVTDFIREVNYKREGRGTYYFEPEHLQYIPLRKELLDTVEVQLSEATGSLVTFGQGVTMVTFHLKKSMIGNGLIRF